MEFSAQNVAISALMTADMSDRERATQLSLVSGMLGPNNMTGVLVLTAIAREQDDAAAGAPTTPAATGKPAQPPQPQVSGVQLPDVAGMIPDDAQELLQGRGLKTTTAQVESTDPAGLVVSSDPQADTVVSRGSTVRIYVSAGVLVPDVTGKSADDAVSELEVAGFEPGDITTGEGTGRAGTVATQDPAGGTFAEAGSTVALTLYERRERTLRNVEAE